MTGMIGILLLFLNLKNIIRKI